jgi:hypothetical protein
MEVHMSNLSNTDIRKELNRVLTTQFKTIASVKGYDNLRISDNGKSFVVRFDRKNDLFVMGFNVEFTTPGKRRAYTTYYANADYETTVVDKGTKYTRPHKIHERVEFKNGKSNYWASTSSTEDIVNACIAFTQIAIIVIDKMDNDYNKLVAQKLADEKAFQLDDN